MILLELKESDKILYNQFVAAQTSGSFLQSWEWGEWQFRLGRTVSRFMIEDDSGNKISSIQLIKMPLPFGKYYLYAPYGPVLSTQYAALSIELMKQLKNIFPDAVFIRIEPKQLVGLADNLPISLVKSTNIQPGKTLIIDLAKSEEELLAEMHHKTRYNIKLAQKHGVEIKDEFQISIGHGLFFEEALKLIMETSNRQNFSTYESGYYKKLVDFFTVQNPGQVKLHVYKAVFQNHLLSSAIMIDFGETRTFLFGGSSEFHRNVMAPYLMHFQAMQDAKKIGLKFYDFWGIETSTGEVPGFVRFKLGFGGKAVEYGGAYDVVLRPIVHRSYKLLRKLNRLFKKPSQK